jgi:hypothetical protein
MTWLLGAVDGVDRRLYMDISVVTCQLFDFYLNIRFIA